MHNFELPEKTDRDPSVTPEEMKAAHRLRDQVLAMEQDAAVKELVEELAKHPVESSPALQQRARELLGHEPDTQAQAVVHEGTIYGMSIVEDRLEKQQYMPKIDPTRHRQSKAHATKDDRKAKAKQARASKKRNRK